VRGGAGGGGWRGRDVCTDRQALEVGMCVLEGRGRGRERGRGAPTDSVCLAFAEGVEPVVGVWHAGRGGGRRGGGGGQNAKFLDWGGAMQSIIAVAWYCFCGNLV